MSLYRERERHPLRVDAVVLLAFVGPCPDGCGADHVNGDPLDNRLENLRILCPNCHTLQSTHRGLNKKSMRAKS